MATFPQKYDIHEIMKNEMSNMRWDINSAVHNARSVETTKAPPKVNGIGFSDTYIYCDSFNKEKESEPSSGLYIYDINRINNSRPIENFIEVEIYFPFFIPQPPVDTTYQPEYFYFRHIQITVEPITRNQQVRGDNKFFHFDIELDHTGGNTFRAMFGLSKYIFSIPMTDIRELRIQFSVPPERKVAFLEDIFNVVAVSSAGPSPLNRRMTTSTPHNLTIGSQYSIFVKNFDSIDSVLNNIMNDKRGHLITVIDSTTIEFTNTPNADKLGTALNASGGLATATIYIGERRIAFILRFRELKQNDTNFITL